MNKLSAVVPVAPWDFERSQLMFRSLKKFFRPEDIDKIYVTFPDKERMKDQLRKLNLDFTVEVLTEEDLIPANDYKLFQKRKGWLRQQIVKMYVSTLMKTDFYICLDSDVVCIKPVTYNNLIKDGKPGINMEPKTWHESWWKASRKVLKTPDPETTTGMSSSTNIFITGETLSLIQHIENLYRKSFARALLNWFWTDTYKFKREWTEYKLYWLYIEYRNKVDVYDQNNKIWGKSIWKSTKEINEDLFREVFDPLQEGYFTICQSTRITDDTVRQYAERYLAL